MGVLPCLIFESSTLINFKGGLCSYSRDILIFLGRHIYQSTYISGQVGVWRIRMDALPCLVFQLSPWNEF